MGESIKKRLSLILVVALILAGLPVDAEGSDEGRGASVLAVVADWNAEVGGSVTASVEGDVITVSGTAGTLENPVRSTLELVIDSHQKVVWEADLIGKDSGTIVLGSGTDVGGTFEVRGGIEHLVSSVTGGMALLTANAPMTIHVNGGTVKTSGNDGRAIGVLQPDVTINITNGGQVVAAGNGSEGISGHTRTKVMVSGDGTKVSAVNDGEEDWYSGAIVMEGADYDVAVEDGALVESTGEYSSAILLYHSGKLSVDDAMVQASGEGFAIEVLYNEEAYGPQNKDTDIRIRNHAKVVSSGNSWGTIVAVTCVANLSITDAEVKNTSDDGSGFGSALYTGDGRVTIDGDSVIHADVGNTIHARGNVTISGGAQVTTTMDMPTIYVEGDLAIHGDAEVEGNSNYAIGAEGDVTVSGTAVVTSSGDSPTIYSTGDSVHISGDATISPTGNSNAINTSADVTIDDNALVESVGDWTAIYTFGGGNVHVGGEAEVLGHAGGAAVYTDEGGAVTISGDAVVSSEYVNAINSSGKVTIRNNALVKASGEYSTIWVSSADDQIEFAGGVIQNNYGGVPYAIDTNNEALDAVVVTGSATIRGEVYANVTVEEAGTLRVGTEMEDMMAISEGKTLANNGTVVNGNVITNYGTITNGVGAVFTMADDAFLWNSPVITGLKNGKVNQPYGETPALHQNGEAIDSADDTSGAWPNGLSMDAAGDITGTPLEVGETNDIRVKVFGAPSVLGGQPASFEGYYSMKITEGDSYAVKVNNGSSDYAEYEEGDEVTITAVEAPNGQRFKEWMVVNGGVVLDDAASTTTTFTMPVGDVEVTATYEAKPALTGTVTLTVNSATGEVVANAAGGNVAVAGTLTYTWSGGASGTGTTSEPTLGMEAKCTVTGSDATGSITESVTVYKVESELIGNVETDAVTIADAYGKVGDAIDIAYTVAQTGTQENGVAFTGGGVVDSGSSATCVIAATDAVSGIITITATFTHTNVPSTPEPTATPTAVPTATPTAVPTATPTIVPTASPTAVPTSDYTLYYDSEDGGKFFKYDVEEEEPTEEEVTGLTGCTPDGPTLKLDGFHFETTADIALVVADGVTIDLTGDSTIAATAATNEDGIGTGIGILATGALTFSGTGSLRITASQYGLQTIFGDLTVAGGTITVDAAGIMSHGLSLGGNMKVTGGKLIATSDIVQAAGVSMVYYGYATIDADIRGSADASGIPLEEVEIGAYGTQNEDQVYRTSESGEVAKYLEFTKAGSPKAAFGDVTVSGTMGTGLSGQTVTITLTNDTVASEGIDVDDAASWLMGLDAGLPADVTVAADGTAGENTITLSFGGTPTAASTAVFGIKIPASALAISEEDLTATGRAQFAITAAPTATPTAVPTATPTAAPTASPTTTSPTAAPTASPTATPTASPTATPTTSPTATPTTSPTAVPTASPTAVPTATPTTSPTTSPTAAPTAVPTATPTAAPTTTPMVMPTAMPTAVPTTTPVAEVSTVTKVTILNSSTIVVQGKAQTFQAEIIGTNSPSQDVTWSIAGNQSNKTSIAQTGRLAVGADEMASVITVKATSQTDTTKSATIDIRVAARKGTEVVSGKFKYRITNERTDGSGTAVLIGLAEGKSVKTVTVPKTATWNGFVYKVTAVGAKAFYKNAQITSATIGNNVIKIGKRAFRECTNLTKVTVGNRVKVFANGVFYKCPKLRTVNTGTGLTTIGAHTFCHNTKMRTWNIKSKRLKTVGRHNLFICRRLTINAPSSKVKVYKAVFKKQAQRKNVVVK